MRELNFGFRQINYTGDDYLSEQKKEFVTMTTQPKRLSEAENETLQKGFTGSKYVKVNSDGMYEVKLTNEPSRLFYSVNDALKFELVKTEEKYKRLAAKVKELDKYLRENRSFMLQKDIKKAEDTIKQGLEVLSTYKKRISSLTSEIAKQQLHSK